MNKTPTETFSYLNNLLASWGAPVRLLQEAGSHMAIITNDRRSRLTFHARTAQAMAEQAYTAVKHYGNAIEFGEHARPIPDVENVAAIVAVMVDMSAE